jgi:hypothetical protein
MRLFGVFLGGRNGWLAEAGGQDVSVNVCLSKWPENRGADWIGVAQV